MRRMLIPAWHYRACAIVERVWGWSPVEEIVLLFLSKNPGSTDRIANSLGLPRQLVTAAVDRFMRYGLLDLCFDGKPAFVLNETGKLCARGEKPLPERCEHRELGVSLVYEKLGDSVLRFKDIRGKWRPLNTNAHDAVKVEFNRSDPGETHETLEELAWGLVRQNLRTGEVERTIRTCDSRIRQGYLEIDLEPARDGLLPKGASDKLHDRVQRFLKDNRIPRISKKTSKFNQDAACVKTNFHPDQLILGGAEHLGKAEEVIDSAREDVFILSTFVASQGDTTLRINRERIWSALDRAVARGVRCHFFYGTSEDDTKKHSMALEELRKRLVKQAVSPSHVLVHYHSVCSHAKILAADDGEGGAVVILGSCNWLLSPFIATELSIELREPTAAAEGLSLFSAVLSQYPDATSSIDVLRSMAAECRRQTISTLYKQSSPAERVTAKLNIVYAHEHEIYLRKAAHGTHNRILVATARMGAPMVPGIFNPLNAVDVDERHVLYSKVAGPTKKRHVRKAKEKYSEKINTIGLKAPVLHGKFLLWGDDDIIVTSMNWGSQQGDAKAPYDELGIHISAKNAATELFELLEARIPQLKSI